MARRFEIAVPRGTSDGESWRVSARQVLLLVVAGLAIVGAIYLIEGPGASGGQPIQLEGTLGRGPRVGEPAPDFALRDHEGQPISVSELRGRPVLLNFWATWCPPCRAEMPELDEVAREQAAAGLVVVAVNLQEEPGQVAGYLRTLDVRLRSAIDADGAVFRQYRIAGLPTTVAIDRDGVVRDIHVGPLVKRAILARVQKIT